MIASACKLRRRGRRYATTIHVLVSGITKVRRIEGNMIEYQPQAFCSFSSPLESSGFIPSARDIIARGFIACGFIARGSIARRFIARGFIARSIIACGFIARSIIALSFIARGSIARCFIARGFIARTVYPRAGVGQARPPEVRINTRILHTSKLWACE
jgi:hypothetical protein